MWAQALPAVLFYLNFLVKLAANSAIASNAMFVNQFSFSFQVTMATRCDGDVVEEKQSRFTQGISDKYQLRVWFVLYTCKFACFLVIAPDL